MRRQGWIPALLLMTLVGSIVEWASLTVLPRLAARVEATKSVTRSVWV